MLEGTVPDEFPQSPPLVGQRPVGRLPGFKLGGAVGGSTMRETGREETKGDREEIKG